MSERCKYVMFDWQTGEVPILFPSQIGHNEIVQMVKSVYPGIEPVSAGFVSPDKTCYGESVSIKLSSRKVDTNIVKIMFKEDY